jgi:hypothetical protein
MQDIGRLLINTRHWWNYCHERPEERDRGDIEASEAVGRESRFARSS